MKLFQSVLLLLALQLQKSQAMKAAHVLLFHSIVSVYSCDFTKHPLNVAESRMLKNEERCHRWASCNEAAADISAGTVGEYCS